MSEMHCPNCGHHLVSYRTDRQRAGYREVLLHWLTCTRCRHVALQSWSVLQDPHRIAQREDRSSGPEHTSRRGPAGYREVTAVGQRD